MHCYFRILLHAAALTPMAVFAAQPAATAHPATAASTPSVNYESVFTGYRPFSDEKLAPWREVNDEVGRVGGQAGIFGGAGHAGHGGAKPVTNTPAPAAAAPKTPSPMHGPGHQGMKK